MRVARFAALITYSVFAVLFGLAPAMAEKRVALIIGNSAYQKAAKLTNPPNDAVALAGMFKAAGFDSVELRQNLGIRDLRQAINDFADMARDADAAVVYYSGHGIEVNGVNYLIPVDAVLNRDSDVSYETFSLDNLVQALEPARRLRLVILDACRENPFTHSMKRTIGTRAIGRGLAAVEPVTVNTLIGFAAKAGSAALDGDGANSPYATALLNNLTIPGLDLRIAFGRVRDEVLKTTKNQQEPFVYGSLGGANVSIVEASAAADASLAARSPSPAMQVDPAAQAWSVIQNTTSVAVLDSYIEQYGNSPYGRMARARRDELKKSQVATATPANPPSATPPSVASAPAGACSRILGTWLWYNGVSVTVNPNNTTTQSDGHSAHVVCADGAYTFIWSVIAKTRMKLSSDGRRLAGTSLIGPTSAVRR
jgi:Caspase domain